MKRALLGLSVAIFVSASLPAQAASVNVIETVNAWEQVNLSQTLSTSGGTWFTAPSIKEGHTINQWRSPFDPSGTTTPPLNWQTIDYYSVGPSSATQTAVLKFTQNQGALEFLWGSIDDYNKLIFFLDGQEVATVLLASLPGVQVGVGAALVSITDLVFNKIKFISTTNAFEFSNLTTSPVPLPPAVLLFGSVLLGWGYLTRRRARLAAA
jgi:hypothetical protein